MSGRLTGLGEEQGAAWRGKTEKENCTYADSITE